jgi:hypothetical protein
MPEYVHMFISHFGEVSNESPMVTNTNFMTEIFG